MEHEPQASVSTDLSSSPRLSQVYILILEALQIKRMLKKFHLDIESKVIKQFK